MTSRPRLAVLEDNQDLREELLFFFDARGYTAWGAGSAEQFWRMLHANPADIVLIDLGLPGEDGLSVLDYLRELGQFGTVVITARGGQQDRLRGLEHGADLYLVKPVNFAQLAKDVDALWYRLQDTRARVPAIEAAPASACRDGWHLDPLDSSLASPEGATLSLTSQELALVRILMREPGNTLPKHQVHDELFGAGEASTDLHRVDVVLSRLRQKASAQKIRLPIRTVFGRGLVFIDTRSD